MKIYRTLIIIIGALLFGALPLRAEKYWLGDLNKDNQVSVADLVLLNVLINTPKQAPQGINLKAADMNRDNSITEEDLEVLRNTILELTPMVELDDTQGPEHLGNSEDEEAGAPKRDGSDWDN